MEIIVQQRMTGQEFRERILEQYGSRADLERAANMPNAHEANDALMDLDLLEESAERLSMEYVVEEATQLSSGEIARLTESRLALLEALTEAGAPLNITGLATRLRRDKKNVSEDVRTLTELGLLATQRVGREKRVRLRGTEIHILLGP